MIPLHNNQRSTSLSSCLLLLLLTVSCTSVKQLAIEKDTSQILKDSEVFSKHFTGFSLFDLDENKYIANYNSILRFTPASNTKLLTMYVALKSFQDSIPGILYNQKPEKLHVIPVGDPSFLNKKFKAQPVLELLKKHESIAISWPIKDPTIYGSGWAWDDYSYDFQPQQSWWPIYANQLRIEKNDSTILITPKFFEDFVDIRNNRDTLRQSARDLFFNHFTIYEDSADYKKSIPFLHSKELLKQLLKDTLKASVVFSENTPLLLDTLYSQSLDTVLQKIMKPSDNFLAEQLLLMSAWKNGYDNIQSFTKYVKTVWLSDLNDLVWVDGSGLSRYNLITPVDQVRLLKKCVDEFGYDRVINLLPTGGEGTLKNLYFSEEPFIFAKTGTLSNNHNLTGFLITKSGKRLIFSMMNNHYVLPNQEIKRAIENFLIQVRNSY